MKVLDGAGIKLTTPGSAVRQASVARHVTNRGMRSRNIICSVHQVDPDLGAATGFYTKLIVWGSLGLNFEYAGGPIIEIGGPIFLYKLPEDRKKQSLIRLSSN